MNQSAINSLIALAKANPDGAFIRTEDIESKIGVPYDESVYHEMISEANKLMQGVCVLVSNSWIGYTLFRRSAHPVRQL